MAFFKFGINHNGGWTRSWREDEYLSSRGRQCFQWLEQCRCCELLVGQRASTGGADTV